MRGRACSSCVDRTRRVICKHAPQEEKEDDMENMTFLSRKERRKGDDEMVI